MYSMPYSLNPMALNIYIYLIYIYLLIFYNRTILDSEYFPYYIALGSPQTRKVI